MRRERRQTRRGPVSGQASIQAFSAPLSASPSQRVPGLLWPLVRSQSSAWFAASVHVACDAAMGLDRRSGPNSTGAICPVFGEPYDQGKFEPNRACTRCPYLTSCVSLVVGRKGIEGLQRFQPEHLRLTRQEGGWEREWEFAGSPRAERSWIAVHGWERVSSRLVGPGAPISGVRWRLLLQTFCKGNWTTDSSCSEKFAQVSGDPIWGRSLACGYARLRCPEFR